MGIQETVSAPSPFDDYRKRTRNRAIAIALGIVVLIAGIKGVFMYLDPLRVLNKHRAELEAQRAQFCRVLDAEKARGGKAVPVASGEEVATSWSTPWSKPSPYDRPPGNADIIERPQLEELCKGANVSSGTLTDAMLPPLLDEKAAERYDRKGYEASVGVAARSKYLVVLDVGTFTQNVSTGAGSMDPGKFAAKAALYSLADAKCLGTVEASGRGPGYVSVLTFKGLGVSDQSQVDSSLAWQSKERALSTIGEAFKSQGRDVQLVRK